jgi:Fe2+ or Zn2+ uptake regulation protein
MIDLLRSIRDHLQCTSCGESIDVEGNDPWELLLTSHYCPPQWSLDAPEVEILAS